MNPEVPPSSLPLLADTLQVKLFALCSFQLIFFPAAGPEHASHFFLQGRDSPLFLCFGMKTGIGGS